MHQESIKLSPQRRQLIGVQYATVSEQHISKTLRTVGRVTYDETKIAHVHTKFSGWIEKVHVDFTGKLVKKGQPLVSIYSPDLVSTQQELLIAKRSRDILSDNPYPEVSRQARTLYDSTRWRLRLWDVTEAQIKEIEKRDEPLKTLSLHSSIDGYVLNRNVFPGQQVSPEMELYTIVDLSNIWVLADIYEYEVPLIQLGQTARMTLAYYPGKTFQGKVTYISPEMDKSTRTLKARIDFANPSLQLKPDMYANVELEVDFGKKLAVSQNAVLDSGTSKTVFVARENGYFEPRQVTLGPKVNDQLIVLEGLKAGEKIVTSGNFLIDSESQLKSAVGSLGGAHAGHGGGIPESPPSKSTGGEKPAVDHSQHEPEPSSAGQ